MTPARENRETSTVMVWPYARLLYPLCPSPLPALEDIPRIATFTARILAPGGRAEFQGRGNGWGKYLGKRFLPSHSASFPSCPNSILPRDTPNGVVGKTKTAPDWEPLGELLRLMGVHVQLSDLNRTDLNSYRSRGFCFIYERCLSSV